MRGNYRISIWGLCAVFVVGCHSAPAPTPPAAVAAKTGGSSARRSVKTATDPDAGKIDTTPKDTTIEQIVAQKAPADLKGRSNPFELATWRVKTRLDSVQLMKDGDYYLVMSGEKGGKTVVEVPDPAECKGSPLQAQIAQARKEIEDRYHPTKEIQKLDQPATVTGVGFLGWGAARKSTKKSAEGHYGARLMPGLGFEFGP